MPEAERDRILVVDDDETLVELWSRFFKGEGFDVVSATTAPAALKVIGEVDFAVALIDIVLPGGSGLDVLREAKRTHPECEVVIASANTTMSRAVDALNAGAFHLIEKPVESLDFLAHTVRAALERRGLILRALDLSHEIDRKAVEIEAANRRLNALHRAARVLTSLHSTKVIFQELVTIIARELQSRRVSVMRIVESGTPRERRLGVQAAIGLPDDAWRARPRVGEGIAGYVAATGRALCINDHESLRASDKTLEEFVLKGSTPNAPFPKSLTVPILLKERVIGVVNVTEMHGDGVYTQTDIEFVQQLVAQAGLVLENAELIQEIISARDFNATILDAVPYPIVVLDSGFRLVAENRAYREIFSTPSFITLSTPLGVLPLAASSREVVRESLSRLQRQNEPVKLYDLSGVTADGTRAIYDFTLCALENPPRGARFVVLFEDVTRKRRIEARVLQEDKMASLGILAAGIAHEVNNPMAYVKANSEQLATTFEGMRRAIEAWHSFGNDLAARGEHRAARARIAEIEREIDLGAALADSTAMLNENLEGIQRVQTIVGDLRSFAHPEPARPTECNVNRLVERALNLSRHELRAGTSLELDLTATKRFLGFPQRIEQVLINLIVNAGQAVKEDTGEVRVRSFDEESYVCISVADTGCGISPDHLKRIFEPFFTTKEVGQGMGMGLTISFNIVKDHGGRIDVESELGKGTTFTVWLPADRT